MSKIINNPLLKGASGMLGGVIVYRELNGRMIMSNRPRRTGESTAAQEAVRARFARAAQYARAKMGDPVSRAEYEAGISATKPSAYIVAITDYLRAPVVHEIDRSRYEGQVGDPLIVFASDDFKVASVQVAIIGPDGSPLESGDAALQPETLTWLYNATVANDALAGTRIVATARDNAGNATPGEVIL